MCDGLAKHAVARAIRTSMKREETQLLPSEDVAVFVNNKKITYDLVKAANSPKFDAAGSFKEAATEALARRKAKLAAQEV